MSIPELFIKRHVMAWMIGFIFILFGVIGYTRIPVQRLPSAIRPVVTITTRLPGGDPHSISQSISRRIEQVMNQINGVKDIHSVSKLGESQVELTFSFNTNMNMAITQIQSQLNSISYLFPKNTKPSVIEFSSIGSRPIMLISFYGNDTLDNISSFINKTVRRDIEGIDGVANARIVGVGEKGIHIIMNLHELRRYRLTPTDIITAFDKHHINEPGGYVRNNRSRFVLDLDMEFHSPVDFENMVIKYEKSGPVYLKNVAKVEYSSGDNSGMALFNGKPSVGISIIKKPDSNTISIVNEVEKLLATKVKAQMPSGVKYNIVYENASHIKHSIFELERDAWLSILTAGIIIFLFLLSFRASAIIATAIPVSLLGVVAVIYFVGYSFNTITLLGIILLVGVVVDDAIIVLENVYRHMQDMGKKAKEVAVKASNEVVFAVLASSLSLIAIFLPIVFLQGEVSLYFKSFAVVVTAGVVISFIVSLTMTPMMCSRFLKTEKHPSRFIKYISGFILSCENVYRRWLKISLENPWKMMLLFVFFIAAAIPAYLYINKEFIPAETTPNVFRINVDTPVGSSNAFVQNRISQLTTIIKKTPGVKSYFSTVTDAGKGDITVRLKNKNERKLSQEQIVAKVVKAMKTIPGAIFTLQSEDQGKSITFQLRGPNLQEVLKLSNKVLSILNANADLSPVYVHMGDQHPSYKVEVNRELVSKYGLSTKEVLNAISSLSTNGLLIGYFNRNSSTPRAEVSLRSANGEFRGEADFHKITLRNQQEKLVNLDEVAKIVPQASLAEISRDNLNYSVSFSAVPKVSMGKATQIILQSMKNKLPKEYEVVMTGEAVSLQETTYQVKLAVLLIILLLYIVLASQFNSFLQPVIVMIAIPLAIVGGLLLLWVSTLSFNIYSMIGMMLLMGLVAKNSILLIDLTNHLRREGKTILEALSTACPIRMRPVLMTSLSIIFALLPAAILNSGSERGLSVVIIGGMVSSTILSLIMVPSAYLLLERRHDRKKVDS